MEAPSEGNPGHAFLAPSGSSRWLTCTASPGYIAGLGAKADTSSSAYAEEGTEAHELAEDCLLVGIDTNEVEGIPEEMQEYVQGYLDFVRGLAEGRDLLIESKLPLWYAPDTTGTMDAGYAGNRKLTIADLKYGAGVSVQADRNTQLGIYGRSLLEYLGLTGEDIDEVEIYVYQPRVWGEEPIRSWYLSYDEFIAFTDPVYNTAKKILANPVAKDLQFHASPVTCKFCPAQAFCKAHTQMLLGDTPLEVEAVNSEPDLPSPGELSMLELSVIHENAKAIKNWLEKVDNYLYNKTEEGHNTGYKMVRGKAGNRAYSDESKAEKWLTRQLKQDERYKKTLVSPAQAEKLLKKKDVSKAVMANFEKLIYKPKGGRVLAKTSDPREALPPEGSEDFENLDQGEEEDLI